MKLLRELNSDFDAIEVKHLESVDIHEQTDPATVLSVIGLVAPIIIKILEVWKKLPGKKKTARNLCLDKAIAALSVASLFSAVKFNK